MIYQILLRNFTPEGTLEAAEKLLPHIKSIGADIVYLCPTFAHDDDMDPTYWSARQKLSGMNNPKNPYRMSDFYHTDPEYGTDDDLKHFVAAAHELGLKVMFDLVYYHCGPKAVFLEEHPDFVKRKEDGSFDLGRWAFPVLDYDNPALCEYMWQNMEYLVRDFDCDGFRCDVGDLVPIDFWVEGRRRVKAIKDDFVMLIEGLYEPRWREAFDLIYEFWLSDSMKAVLDGRKTTAELIARREEYLSNYIYGGTTLLNWENHDYACDAWYNRPDRKFGRKATDTMLVSIYTMAGEPFLYCGNEVADGNRQSLWASRFYGANLTIDWQNLLTEDGQARLALVRQLDSLRRNSPALSHGTQTFLPSTNEKLLTFTREADGQKLLVAINMGNGAVEFTANYAGEALFQRDATLANGKVTLGAYGFAVLAL